MKVLNSSALENRGAKWAQFLTEVYKFFFNIKNQKNKNPTLRKERRKSCKSLFPSES
jgi:hypothetical protein